MFFSLKKYFVIFITLFSFQGFSETTDFTDPTDTPTHIIPELANQGFSPQITTDSSGRNVYAIWAEGNVGIVPIQVAISNDFGVTWQDPTDTPTHTSPTIALGNSPQIITDGSGQFVYAIWAKGSVGIVPIQVAISNDFGVTWQDPTDTPTHTSPTLASGKSPQIITDGSGLFVYAIWAGSGGKIQVAISNDFGVNWVNPTSTPGPGGPPDLDSSGFDPQITTDSSGKYVYAVWKENTNPIQVAISNDFGVNWAYPSSTPGPGGPPDLATSGENPQITTDSSGKYIYAIWRELPTKIQVAISNDFGVNWAYPSSTPTGSIPDLASLGVNPQITTDSSGRYVYAIWTGNSFKIQVAISQDFGVTWADPASTPTGSIPDLASSGFIPQITTDSSGRYVYAIWATFSNAIQVAISLDAGKNWQNPTSTPTGIIPNLAAEGETPQIITSSSGRNVYAIWIGGIPYPVEVAIGRRTFFPITTMRIERPS